MKKIVKDYENTNYFLWQYANQTGIKRTLDWIGDIRYNIIGEPKPKLVNLVRKKITEIVEKYPTNNLRLVNVIEPIKPIKVFEGKGKEVFLTIKGHVGQYNDNVRAITIFDKKDFVNEFNKKSINHLVKNNVNLKTIENRFYKYALWHEYGHHLFFELVKRSNHHHTIMKSLYDRLHYFIRNNKPITPYVIRYKNDKQTMINETFAESFAIDHEIIPKMPYNKTTKDNLDDLIQKWRSCYGI